MPTLAILILISLATCCRGGPPAARARHDGPDTIAYMVSIERRPANPGPWTINIGCIQASVAHRLLEHGYEFRIALPMPTSHRAVRSDRLRVWLLARDQDVVPLAVGPAEESLPAATTAHGPGLEARFVFNRTVEPIDVIALVVALDEVPSIVPLNLVDRELIVRAARDTANPPPCSTCRSQKGVVPIVYGYPTDETFARARKGTIALGGCVLNANRLWMCRACKKRW